MLPPKKIMRVRVLSVQQVTLRFVSIGEKYFDLHYRVVNEHGRHMFADDALVRIQAGDELGAVLALLARLNIRTGRGYADKEFVLW